jgi:hypothetical protein
VPRAVHRLGRLGHLLFKSAVGRGSPGTSGGLYGVPNLGSLVFALAAQSAVAAVLFLCVVAWWITIPPHNDRNWRPEVAAMPRDVIDGDRVRLTGVRNLD